MKSPLKHTSSDPIVDFLTEEPVVGDCRLASILLFFVLLGAVGSEFVDVGQIDGLDPRYYRVQQAKPAVRARMKNSNTVAFKTRKRA